MDGSVTNGPPAWANWRSFDQGGSDGEVLEYVLYSDCRWVGEITEGIGPYELLNTIGARPHPAIGEAQPVLALRVEQALDRPPSPEDPSRHVPGTFHGGWIDEEVAALLSLILGVRCRSGGMWRSFEPENDPKGKPFTFNLQPPLLAHPQSHPQLPHLPVEARFEEAIEWLNRYRQLAGQEAVVVARSARAFQLGIWTSDDDPDLSWLRLITALETAAKSWAGKAPEGPVDQLASTWPELAELLRGIDPQPRDQIAALIAPQSRIKRAVLKFVAKFAPGPPELRPRELERLDWSRLEEHISAIYDRRSEMLHEAIPLPRSMTTAHRLTDGPPFTETAFTTGYHDSNWPQTKAPMPLWTFSYIVAGTLRNWWRALGDDDAGDITS